MLMQTWIWLLVFFMIWNAILKKKKEVPTVGGGGVSLLPHPPHPLGRFTPLAQASSVLKTHRHLCWVMKIHHVLSARSRIYRVAQKKRNSQYGRFFRSLFWSTAIFFTLLDRASSSHYINSQIIKFGWELFILWVISYGLSSSGFARVSRHDDKLMANPKNDSP